jgi:hypothetical protein
LCDFCSGDPRDCHRKFDHDHARLPRYVSSFLSKHHRRLHHSAYNVIRIPILQLLQIVPQRDLLCSALSTSRHSDPPLQRVGATRSKHASYACRCLLLEPLAVDRSSSTSIVGDENLEHWAGPSPLNRGCPMDRCNHRALGLCDS